MGSDYQSEEEAPAAEEQKSNVGGAEEGEAEGKKEEKPKEEEGEKEELNEAQQLY